MPAGCIVVEVSQEVAEDFLDLRPEILAAVDQRPYRVLQIRVGAVPAQSEQEGQVCLEVPQLFFRHSAQVVLFQGLTENGLQARLLLQNLGHYASK